MVIFHRLADSEFVRARRRYARLSAGLEMRFVEAINAIIAQIESNPNSGVAHFGAIRWLKPRRFPYLVYFENAGNGTSLVFAMSHKLRKPGYWLKRRFRS